MTRPAEGDECAVVESKLKSFAEALRVVHMLRRDELIPLPALLAERMARQVTATGSLPLRCRRTSWLVSPSACDRKAGRSRAWLELRSAAG